MDFEDFLDRELGTLSGYARALTGDRQSAHDVLADALIAAHARWRRIGAMDSPGGYVRRIVTTTFLAEKRRWASRTIAVTSSGEVPELGMSGGQVSVDDRAELHGMLAGLPRQQRAAIVLRFYLDLPDDEIAAELGCSAGAARTYISRGLATLRITAAGSDAPLTSPGRAAGDSGKDSR